MRKRNFDLLSFVLTFEGDAIWMRYGSPLKYAYADRAEVRTQLTDKHQHTERAHMDRSDRLHMRGHSTNHLVTIHLASKRICDAMNPFQNIRIDSWTFVCTSHHHHRRHRSIDRF